MVDMARFERDGFARVEEAVPREVALRAEAALREAVRRAEERAPGLVFLDGEAVGEAFPAIAASGSLRAAARSLLGERAGTLRSLGSAAVLTGRTEPRRTDQGWHIDGNVPDGAGGYLFSWRSEDRGLLVLILLSDAAVEDGATALLPGSHRLVGPAIRSEGLVDSGSVCARIGAVGLIADQPAVAYATGNAGDAYMCHPHLVHATGNNTSGRFRAILQPSYPLTRPFAFEPDALCAVERGHPGRVAVRSEQIVWVRRSDRAPAEPAEGSAGDRLGWRPRQDPVTTALMERTQRAPQTRPAAHDAPAQPPPTPTTALAEAGAVLVVGDRVPWDLHQVVGPPHSSVASSAVTEPLLPRRVAGGTVGSWRGGSMLWASFAAFAAEPDWAAIARDYQGWTRAADAVASPSVMGLCRMPMRGVDTPYHGSLAVTVYVNEVARAAFAQARGPRTFPEGSILVKVKIGHGPDDPLGLGVMVKRAAGYAPDRGDWQYALIDKDATHADQQELSHCASCHIAKAGVGSQRGGSGDSVFLSGPAIDAPASPPLPPTAQPSGGGAIPPGSGR